MWETLSPLTADPGRAAIFLDVDGTLSPIVRRAEDAQVPKDTALLLGRLARRYGCVACISGRAASDVRRLVGVGAVAYAGSHGAELLEPGAAAPAMLPEFRDWEPRVKAFAAARDSPELRALRIRIEDKGPIVSFHWRGARDQGAARGHLERLSGEAEAEGLATHWGRKVVEIRPPVAVDKGRAVRALVERAEPRAALFAGDDVTDLDGFAALDALMAEGRLDHAVRVGVRSDEGPSEIAERADVLVEGVDGFREVLAILAS